jgi:hypothetical protein
MGCAASTSVNAVVPMVVPPPARDVGTPNVQKIRSEAVPIHQHAELKKAFEAVEAIASVSNGEVTALKPPPIEPTDEERSKNTTPYSSNNNGLGCTTPRSPKDIPQDLAASPVDKDEPLLPSMLEPLPAPLDVDAMALSADAALSVPYWEKEPLPARPGTSSRRPQSSGGKKLVVYKTEKTKKLEAEAKKKRHTDDDSTSPDKPARKAPSSLPPLKDRRKAQASNRGEDSIEVLTPSRHQWMGSSGGEAWCVDVKTGSASRTDSLGAEMETRRSSGSFEKRAAADVMSLEESPIKAGPHSDVFRIDEEDGSP